MQGFSRAAIQSYWRLPRWKLSIEAGGCPWEFARSDKLLVTHAHTDHLQGLFTYISLRNLLNLPTAQIYVPEHSHSTISLLLDRWSNLNEENFTYNLKSITASDSIACTKSIDARSFVTDHRLETFGYMISEKKLKLRPEYQSLNAQELAALRKNKVAISDRVVTQKFAFTSDTSIKVFEMEPSLFNVENLVLECTFWDDSTKDIATKTGHIHIDQLVDLAESFKNHRLILCHFSQRYTREYITNICNTRLAPKLKGIELILWL